jgi:predicted phage gp36 major capsid-like protein
MVVCAIVGVVIERLAYAPLRSRPAYVSCALVQLASSDDRTALLADLRRRWQTASDAARKPEDSSERRLARRVLSGLNANLRSTDPDYLKQNAFMTPRNIRAYAKWSF